MTNIYRRRMYREMIYKRKHFILQAGVRGPRRVGPHPGGPWLPLARWDAQRLAHREACCGQSLVHGELRSFVKEQSPCRDLAGRESRLPSFPPISCQCSPLANSILGAESTGPAAPSISVSVHEPEARWARAQHGAGGRGETHSPQVFKILLNLSGWPWFIKRYVGFQRAIPWFIICLVCPPAKVESPSVTVHWTPFAFPPSRTLCSPTAVSTSFRCLFVCCFQFDIAQLGDVIGFVTFSL